MTPGYTINNEDLNTMSDNYKGKISSKDGVQKYISIQL